MNDTLTKFIGHKTTIVYHKNISWNIRNDSLNIKMSQSRQNKHYNKTIVVILHRIRYKCSIIVDVLYITVWSNCKLKIYVWLQILCLLK
jgi:hypothetical protein